MTIRDWVTKTFSSNSDPKLFLELGAHQGEDTLWMSEIPGARVIAFEPDPRNIKALMGIVRNNTGNNLFIDGRAISDRDGLAQLTPSLYGWRREWTFSSSLLKPKNHMQRYPSVTFGQSIAVKSTTLDSAMTAMGTWGGTPIVDFIWCDIQGAEGKMIRGGQETLKQTRYLYMEYSNEELYEGQETLGQLLSLLPGDNVFAAKSAWRMLQDWPDDRYNGNILLENVALNRQLATKKNLNPAEVCA